MVSKNYMYGEWEERPTSTVDCAHGVPMHLICGACNEATKAYNDAVTHGIGVMQDGQHVPHAQFFAEGSKPTNPKDVVGSKKAPLSTVSAPVMAEVGVAMMEGALKYGRHNYRGVGVRASVYYDATIRHLFSWWEGEDTDPDSGMSHVTKAIASLTVLRDAMINDKLEDDRPPVSPNFYAALNKRAEELLERYGHVQPHHYTIKDD